ncbi:MAG TPA: helix-turn-helix domain-containing protein, partial [Herpetosiphonaceae bacterium]
AKYDRACELRRAGWSYSMITEELGVNQSTLSGWLRDVPVEDRSIIEGRIRAARTASGRTNSAHYQEQNQQRAEQHQNNLRHQPPDPQTASESNMPKRRKIVSKKPPNRTSTGKTSTTDYPKLQKAAIRLREQGFSMAQIARRLGVHKSSIHRWTSHIPLNQHNEASRLEQLASFRDNAKYDRACELRRAGWSYSMITKELGVSASTLNSWFKDVVVEDHSIIEGRIKAARKVSGQKNSARYQALAQETRDEGLLEIQAMFADGLTERELFLAGLMLYWGEGAKTQSRIALGNTDPAIIKLFMRWVRESLGLAEDRFRAGLYCYPDTDIPQAESYWSGITGIPLSQFYEAQIDTRTNKLAENQGKQPFGTLHVKVGGEGSTDLHRKVLTWIEFLGRMETS